MKTDHLALFKEIHEAGVPAADFHLHTRWTDGADSVSAMHEAAVASGLGMILFTEHARKTSEDWFFKYAAEVRALSPAKCRALVGAEVKIEDFQGNLDCTEKILKECDLVMGSVHRFPGEKGVVRGFGDVKPEEAEEIEFQLAVLILKNKWVNILAHPFGMCYRRFGVVPTEKKIKELIRLAAQTDKAFEVNCHYHPDPWKLIEWCRDAGARISLGSNAHSVREVGRIYRQLKGIKE